MRAGAAAFILRAMRTLLPLLVAAVALFTACPKAVPKANVAAQAVRLLPATLERETEQLTQTLPEYRFMSDSYDGTAHVVATGETDVLLADDADVTLTGDQAGKEGFNVDNVIILEVTTPEGKLVNRVAVGYHDGLRRNGEEVDALGQRSFTFEPNEVKLRAVLPEHGPFKLKATVLDSGGTGKVSDVWVQVRPHESGQDDLRD